MKSALATPPAPSERLGSPWAVPVLTVAKALGSDVNLGLSADEASRRLAVDGPMIKAVEHVLVLTGLAAMAAPPRSEALEAFRAAESAGLRVVVITGNHPLMGAAIAREPGI